MVHHGQIFFGVELTNINHYPAKKSHRIDSLALYRFISCTYCFHVTFTRYVRAYIGTYCYQSILSTRKLASGTSESAGMPSVADACRKRSVNIIISVLKSQIVFPGLESACHFLSPPYLTASQEWGKRPCAYLCLGQGALVCPLSHGRLSHSMVARYDLPRNLAKSWNLSSALVLAM